MEKFADLPTEELAFCCLQESSSRLAALRQQNAQQILSFEQKALLSKVESALNRAHVLADSTPSSYYESLKHITSEIIHSQVFLDQLNHPEIDPVDGWLETSLLALKEKRSFTISSAFMNLYFQPEGKAGLLGAHYKPRKVDLLQPLLINQWPASFVGRVLDNLQEADQVNLHNSKRKGDVCLTRSLPHLLVCREIEQLHSILGSPLQLYKDFHIRSGLSGFVSNSSYGLELEYWIEAPEKSCDSSFLSLECCFTLPCPFQESQSVRPLLCVGGESGESLKLHGPMLLSSTNFPGGLYGIRLIDGLSSILLELRLAKVLDYIFVKPLFGESIKGQQLAAIQVCFIKQLSKLTADSQSNSLFLSII